MPTKPVDAGRRARRLFGAVVLLAVGAMNGSGAHAASPEGMRITDHLYDTRFITAQDGWVVGAFGTIFRTPDGGTTWRPQVSHTVENLFSIDFADAHNGWAVGRSGTILHTVNGGDTWEIQKWDLDRHLFKVKALDAQHAVAVGDWGAVVQTANGGATWENRSLTRDVILNSESWGDTAHGWIVGEAGTIVTSSDGGATWTDQTSGVEKTLFGVCFTDVQRGWAVGLDGLILRTVDGGQTWQVQHGDVQVSALDQVGFKESIENPTLYDVALAGQYGYAVGDSGSVFVSADAGDTWQRKTVPSAANLRWIRAASLVNGTHGLLVGANGLTIRVVGDQMNVSEKDEHAAEMAH